MTISDALDAAIRDEDLWAVAEVAIALWREVPRTEIAVVVDKIDRALARGVDRPVPPSPEELAAAALRSARERGVLLRALTNEPLAELAPRVEAVRRWHDPRVPLALLDVFRRPRKLARLDEAGLRAVESLLAEAGDRRILAALEGAEMWTAPGWCEARAFTARIERLRLLIGARLADEPAFDDVQRALFMRLDGYWRARRGVAPWALRMSTAERRFWSALADDPDDRRLPLVLADLLAAEGDARAELIVRAAAGEALPAPQLEAAWLGPIASHLERGSARFRGAMLDAVTLRSGARELFLHPLWRTVRELRAPNAAFSVKQWPADLLPSLVRISGLDLRHFVALLQSDTPTRVEEVRLEPRSGLSDVRPKQLPRHSDGVPRLVRLTIAPPRGYLGPTHGLNALFVGPFAARLRSLTVYDCADMLWRWHAVLVRGGGGDIEELIVDQRVNRLGWCPRVAFVRGELTLSMRRAEAAPVGGRALAEARERLGWLPSTRVTGRHRRRDRRRTQRPRP